MKEDLFFGLIIAAAVILLTLATFSGLDSIFATWQPALVATVVDRSHKAESTDVSITYVPDGNGGTMPTCTTTTDPERWDVVFNVQGMVQSAGTDVRTWTLCVPNAQVQVQWKKGCWTGHNRGWRIVNLP